MYNTCFCLALWPPLIAQQYSCSEKTTLFSEQVFEAVGLPHWEASFAASGGGGKSGGRRVENGSFGGRRKPPLGVDERAGGASNRAETY